MKKPYWVSWYCSNPAFEMHSPWWRSGYRDEDETIFCAAVWTESEDEAKAQVLDCYDNPHANVEWRFCRPCRPSWTPFNSRFPRLPWMVWGPDFDMKTGNKR